MSTVLRDVVADVVAAELGAGLEREQDDLLDRALGAVGVDGGHRAGMAGVDRAQEGEGLVAAQLAEDDPVGPHAQRGGEQVVGADLRLAERAARREQADDIVVARRCSSGVSSIRISRSSRRDLADQGVEEGGLAGRGAARDEDVLARPDRGGEHAGDVAGGELRRAAPRSTSERSEPVARLGSRRRRRRRHNRRARGRATTCLRIASASGPRVAGGATICTRAPSGRVAESRGCSRLMPWCESAAIWRASRARVGSSSAGRVVPLDRAADRLDPHLAGAVDVDVGDVGPRQHAGERREIGAQIDAALAGGGGGGAHRRFSTPVKSRSRATKMRDAGALAHRQRRRDLGRLDDLADAAARAVARHDDDRVAVCRRAVARLTPMSSADCRIAPAKRSKKWLLTLARMPPRPSGSPAGEPIAMVTPSGPDQPGPVDQRPALARARPRTRYSPISRLPRGISTRLPSKPRTSRETIARAKPGRVELSAVSSTAGISVPCGDGGRAVGEHAGAGARRRAWRRRPAPRPRPALAVGRRRRRPAAAAGAAPLSKTRAGLGGDARRRRRRLGPAAGVGTGTGCGT